MQLEYESSKEELVSLQEDTGQQLLNIQEKKRKLAGQEAELKAEEEQLACLRAANAKEKEQLLLKQKSELKDLVEREKKILTALKECVICTEPPNNRTHWGQ